MKVRHVVGLLFRKTRELFKDEYPDQEPKKVSDVKGVSFEVKGLCPTYCTCTEWNSGEGFNFEWVDDKGNEKRVALHHNELDAMFACLNDLKYF